MRNSGLILGLVITLLCSARAQVTVEVVLDQDQFLPSEAIVAAVRVTNRSGQTLHLGDSPDWLTFSAERRDGYVVTKVGDPPVVGEFTLESSKVATKRVNLEPYFEMTRPGRYSITASVRIKEWTKDFLSRPKSFDIIDGRKIWEQEFGIPDATGAPGAAPEVRKFALQQANYLKQLKLYVRVTDAAEGRVFRVYALGPMVSFDQPAPQVDKLSRMHVLFQTGARTFQYCVVDANGELIVRQTYDYGEGTSRPTLKVDSEGVFKITGGARRITARDLPLPPPPVVTNSPATNTLETAPSN